MCHNPLLCPVVTDDGCVYNESCLIKYFETLRRKKSLSPSSDILISKNYKKVNHIRTSVITLITETNIFDQWIQDLKLNHLREYNLHRILVQNKKIHLLNNDVKDNLKYIEIMDILDNNNYINARNLIKQNILTCTPTILWIYACENLQESNAINLLDDFQEIDYNFVTNDGICGLLIGLKNHMFSLVSKLMEMPNLNPSIQDNEGNNALMLICMNKSLDESIGIKFIETFSSMDFNQTNSNGSTPLLICCENKLQDIALKILENDSVDKHNYENNEETALSIACNNNLSKVALKLIKKTKINYNFMCENNYHVFISACECECEGIIDDSFDEVIDEFIKKSDLKYNHYSADGYTALIMACYTQNTNTSLKLLCLPNIELNHIDSYGDTAFHCACINGLTIVIEKMLKDSMCYITHVIMDLRMLLKNYYILVPNTIALHPMVILHF